MNEDVPVGLFIISMIISASVCIPLFMSIFKYAKRRRERFRKYSEENGCCVTAYYLKGTTNAYHTYDEHYNKINDSAKYVYYGPDNKRYTTRLTYVMRRSDTVQIYLDPRNYKKVHTDYSLRTGKYIQFIMVLMYPTIIFFGMKLYKFLCLIF